MENFVWYEKEAEEVPDAVAHVVRKVCRKNELGLNDGEKKDGYDNGRIAWTNNNVQRYGEDNNTMVTYDGSRSGLDRAVLGLRRPREGKAVREL